ncbi:MAG: methyltransferase domain-containing protein [Anaerolineae bacterium]|nr:methyltransferase domain-containing protein [Anaerolineae bacterium]
MKSVYDEPRYYEIAFSYRDIAAEVDTFELCFERYSGLPVKSVLELGSGNSPHLEELLSRGYAYTGLDRSEAMLEYSSQKASAIPGKAAFVRGDMVDFTISETFDFVFIMLGSLHTQNTQELRSHFSSVSRVLNRGGLYLLDWCVRFAPFSEPSESWTMERDGIRVTTRYSEKLIDLVEQLVEETFTVKVMDDGAVTHLAETGIRRVIFPQEFLQLIEHSGEFEFVGWWNNWDLESPLGDVKDPRSISRPIILLRRK